MPITFCHFLPWLLIKICPLGTPYLCLHSSTLCLLLLSSVNLGELIKLSKSHSSPLICKMGNYLTKLLKIHHEY